MSKSYPWYTPYQFAGNSPIGNTDLDGAEEYFYKLTFDKKGRAILELTHETYTWWLPDLHRVDVPDLKITYSFIKFIGTTNSYKSFEEFKADPIAAINSGKFENDQKLIDDAVKKLLEDALLLRRSASKGGKTTKKDKINPLIKPSLPEVEDATTQHIPKNGLLGKRVGHTFKKHGSHNTHFLQKQAANSRDVKSIGQWIDDEKAEAFIAANLDKLKNGAVEIELPAGLGRVVNGDGTFTPATHAILVPSKTGVETCYPTMGGELKKKKP